MSRAAYDRVKQALAGTPLEGEMERLNTELHFTPESPEWAIAAIAILGHAGLTQELTKTRLALTDTEKHLPVRLKEAGAVIVKGLAADIASESVEAIRADGLQVIKDEAHEFFGSVQGYQQQILDQQRTDAENINADFKASAAKFGQSAQTATDELLGTATALGTALGTLTQHMTRLSKHGLTIWFGSLVLAIAATFFAARPYYDHVCSVNIEHTHAYSTTAQGWALERAYCP